MNRNPELHRFHSRCTPEAGPSSVSFLKKETPSNAANNRYANCETGLEIGGLARLSTCDWPGMLAATVFCQGCAWDCPYCHNPHLRARQADNPMRWSSVVEFLRSRRGLLDGVVFSGGEPTLQPALAQAIDAVRAMGFKTALHTAGMVPERFAEVLPQVDWVGFDIKAPFQAYARITGNARSAVAAQRSLRLLLESGKLYEVRTTFHPGLLSKEEMIVLRDELLALGVTSYAVQHFRPVGVAAGRMASSSGLQSTISADFGQAFEQFTVR